MKLFTNKPAINYSGYRKNQSPLTGVFPSKEEILEDLKILEGDFYYLRIYDCTEHAYSVLEIIRDWNLDFEVMLGLSLFAEENHLNHPYFYVHPDEKLKNNKLKNIERVKEIIRLAIEYKDIVSSVSVGNETRSIWNNNRVSIETLINITREIQNKTNKPVTFCEEYQHWVEELDELAEVVDFISLHTYPVWQGSKINQALEVAKKNFYEVQNKYPNKKCIITETGWPTKSHGAKIKVEDATIENQIIYNNQITQWGKKNDVLIYIFEAFDEPWKGGKAPDEPEKNWGLYFVDRTKKF